MWREQAASPSCLASRRSKLALLSTALKERTLRNIGTPSTLGIAQPIVSVRVFLSVMFWNAAER